MGIINTKVKRVVALGRGQEGRVSEEGRLGDLVTYVSY